MTFDFGGKEVTAKLFGPSRQQKLQISRLEAIQKVIGSRHNNGNLGKSTKLRNKGEVFPLNLRKITGEVFSFNFQNKKPLFSLRKITASKPGNPVKTQVL